MNLRINLVPMQLSNVCVDPLLGGRPLRSLGEAQAAVSEVASGTCRFTSGGGDLPKSVVHLAPHRCVGIVYDIDGRCFDGRHGRIGGKN